MFASNTSQVSSEAVFIEDTFSTTLYTGNGSTQTITNGIDLAGEGGLVWVKQRNGIYNNSLFDTERGPYNVLLSDQTQGNYNYSFYGVSSFNSNGFGVADDVYYGVNALNDTYASWTFRKAPKFFDVVVKYHAGTSSTRADFSALGTIGCVIAKRTDGTGDWLVAHRSVSSGIGSNLRLNTTAAASSTDAWAFIDGTDGGLSTFAPAGEYVIYGFAHNAGGFGEDGEQNVISCGSFTLNGSGLAAVSLGYEPQWVMYKRTDGAGNWVMFDTMRGWFADSAPNGLVANDAAAEPVGGPQSFVNATGFNVSGSAGQSYIYIAIRRGPMKTPTSGTEVFKPVLQASGGTVTTNFAVDLSVSKALVSGTDPTWIDRLRGDSVSSYNYLISSSTDAEAIGSGFGLGLDNNSGYKDSLFSLYDRIYWNFRRAPGFFDVVCGTSTSATNKPVTHNLAAVPELIIVKKRSASGTNWVVYVSAVTTLSQYLVLNTTAAKATSSNIWGLSAPTSTTFNINENSVVGGTGSTYVAYLFATVAGVSKVGSYTGTGTTQQINCGFSSGARFVLIKRTDSTGDWYVWDSARGIVSGNDPYLLLNSTAAENTSTDYIDPYSAGFEISSTAPAAINASGGSYIYLAIA